MKSDLQLLVCVLAATDAIWLPLRAAEWQHPRPGCVYAAQQAFRQNRGVLAPFPGTAAERKSGERLVDAMIQSGYLQARRRGRGRFLRLVDTAEDRLRQMCGLPGLWLSFETVRRHVRNDWTPEIALNSNRGWGDGRSQELAFVELLLLPALARGLAESGSNVRGHVYYRRVGDPPAWPEPAEDIEPVPELARLYSDELRAARERILAADVGSLEIGLLPIPCSIGGRDARTTS